VRASNRRAELTRSAPCYGEGFARGAREPYDEHSDLAGRIAFHTEKVPELSVERLR
jgi:hypothetical protein